MGRKSFIRMSTTAGFFLFIGHSLYLMGQCAAGHVGLLAQCYHISGGNCPNAYTYVPNAAYGSSGPYKVAGTLQDCKVEYDGEECYFSTRVTSGSCTVASLSRPEVSERLAKLSKKSHLLVASCVGGLVPFKNDEPIFNPEMGLRRNDQLHLDKKPGGE